MAHIINGFKIVADPSTLYQCEKRFCWRLLTFLLPRFLIITVAVLFGSASSSETLINLLTVIVYYCL